MGHTEITRLLKQKINDANILGKGETQSFKRKKKKKAI